MCIEDSLYTEYLSHCNDKFMSLYKLDLTVFFSFHIIFVHVRRYLPITADFLSNYEFLGQNIMILTRPPGS